MIIKDFAERLACELMEQVLPENGYIGLCREINYCTGRVIDEPCIGPKTNYYRVPYNRDEIFEFVGGVFTNGKSEYHIRNRYNIRFDDVGKKKWKEIQYMFISLTADKPEAVTFERIFTSPVTLFMGDIPVFIKHDLEITVNL